MGIVYTILSSPQSQNQRKRELHVRIMGVNMFFIGLHVDCSMVSGMIVASKRNPTVGTYIFESEIYLQLGYRSFEVKCCMFGMNFCLAYYMCTGWELLIPDRSDQKVMSIILNEFESKHTYCFGCDILQI